MILKSICAIAIKGPTSYHIARNMKQSVNIVTKKGLGIKYLCLADITMEKTLSLFIIIYTPLITWKEFNGNMKT